LALNFFIRGLRSHLGVVGRDSDFQVIIWKLLFLKDFAYLIDFCLHNWL